MVFVARLIPKLSNSFFALSSGSLNFIVRCACTNQNRKKEQMNSMIIFFLFFFI